jgi:hypothetical protein
VPKMRTIRTKVYKFNELTVDAQQNAIEAIREMYYENNDFAHWAVDDCALFEPKEKDLIELFGKDYKFPLIENTRESIYFNIDRNSFLDCAKAMQISDDTQFLKWLGITDEFLLQKISFEIYTPQYRNADTIIEFSFDDDFDEPTKEELKTVEQAEVKFNNHIQEILKRIEADIDYRFTDEAIIEDIEANEWEFYKNGKKY